MKKSIFAPISAIALIATLAACGTEAAPEGDSMVAEATETGLFADLGGDATGPVFRAAKADTLAVSGYDVVSYFVGDGVPVVGNEDLTVRYEGFDYRFASEENANAFIEEPGKYAPAYGGYCAWAIAANDALAPGDPEIYEIVDGTLYLNFSTDVQGRWQADIPGFIEAGDVNYPTHSADEHYQD